MRRSHRCLTALSAAILIATSATTAMAATATPTPAPQPTKSASSGTNYALPFQTQSHNLKVPRYLKFSYQTGQVTGIDQAAAKKINAVLKKDVMDFVNPARKAKSDPCTAGAKRCGYFVLQLKNPTCIDGNVCITEPGQSLPPGANTGSSWVNTAVFDATTGEPKTFEQFVPSKQQDAFFKATDAAIAAVLQKGGIDPNDKLWKPNTSLKRIYAWTPAPDGMHLYFNKYDVAPGSFDVVNVTIPWSAFQ